MSKHGGIEQRVWMHWKSLKFSGPEEYFEDAGVWRRTIQTPNHIWLLLARVHKMPVRQVKDIVNARRAL